jgi:pimeloyl-ACP methyl ester carboxylesterase
VPRAVANGIELEYDTAGYRGAPVILLIAGLSAQLTKWDAAFVAALAGHGFFVIRFDNRDVGLSTKLDGPAPHLMAILGGDPTSAPYVLDDMADDALGLLDALLVDAAHVVGTSMGGMIAQCLAIAHPDRCLSLVSIMSTTGAPGVGTPHPEAVEVLTRPIPEGRDAIIEHELDNARVAASPSIPFDEPYYRAKIEAAFDRCWDPRGVRRQIAAVTASPDRTPALRTLAVSTLVIHGAADPLVDVSGGRATAEAVVGADLFVVSGMGHEIPPPFQPTVIEEIVTHAGRNTFIRPTS